MEFLEIVKVILLGIIEGITEWLPISSTGHLILADEFIKLGVSEEFKEMFDVVIQLGAIFAVILLFWNKLWPFTSRKESSGVMPLGSLFGLKKNSASIWIKVIIACVPSILIGLPFEDKIDELFFNPTVVAVALIVYGVAFILIEHFNKNKAYAVNSMQTLSYKTAFFIGCFQVLAMIPGTSRSGSTILGAMLIGASRTVAAEFSFYLAVPTMFGASLLKLLKFGFHFTSIEMVVLAAGMVTAFVVSVIAIKFLLGFIRKKSFAAFGYYRIALGVLVLLYFYLVK